MKQSVLKALQLLAFKAIEEPTWDDFYRGVCRWYSKTFHTPLHEVDKLPKVRVMREWYEDHYQELFNSDDEKKVDRYHELKEQLLYEEELAQRELEDAEWEEQMAEEVAAAQSQGIQDLETVSLRDNEPNLIAEQGNILFDDLIPEEF